MSEPIIFGQPQFGEEEVELVSRTLRSTWIGQGPLVEEFERKLGAAVWADHVAAVGSCTAALELSLLALGIGAGAEVIAPAMTFVATVNAIESTGASTVLADVDPATLLMTPDAARRLITGRTRALMPVSFAGRPLDLTGFLELADERDLYIIEDAAHSVGGVADGQPIGAGRHPRLVTCFSFYPNKNLASAEGGAVTATDPAVTDRIRSLRLHGLNADAWGRYRDRAYKPTLATALGRKANWTDLQAAVALPQLAKLEGFLAAREHLAECYDRHLAGVPKLELFDRPPPSVRQRHALHLYQVRVAGGERDALIAKLRADGIGAAVHYPAIHHHPFYEHLARDDLGESDRAALEVLSLPMHPGMVERHIVRVAEAIAQSLG
ncbi:MAG: DegT/DnrJ/EryC1/StrS aminotransferase family protein [Actinobacteria bacterium]|nr:DegT/DnrJ/EryC1/StrS aminotransferase family protein [Actinomycetota bacterium]